MFTERTGVFETNSSSSHKFLVPKDGALTFPKVVNIHKTYDFNSIEGRISLLFDAIDTGDWEEFVKYLRELGIEVEGFRPTDEEYCPPFFRNQSEMTRFLFGETICTSSWYEGCSTPNVEQSTDHLKNLEDYDKVEIRF